MRQPMEAVMEVVPTGTTEGEADILVQTFVRTHIYKDVITPPIGSPRILIGKKGTGKSALMVYAMADLLRRGVNSIIIRPDNIQLSSNTENNNVGTLKAQAYKSLIQAVSVAIGQNLSGLLSNSDNVLRKRAIESGKIEEDVVEWLSRVLPSLVKEEIGVDVSAIANKKPEEGKLEAALSENLRRSSGALYIFVDDTDQLASPDVPGHLNRIWGFLLGARELAGKFRQIAS